MKKNIAKPTKNFSNKMKKNIGKTTKNISKKMKKNIGKTTKNISKKMKKNIAKPMKNFSKQIKKNISPNNMRRSFNKVRGASSDVFKNDYAPLVKSLKSQLNSIKIKNDTLLNESNALRMNLSAVKRERDDFISEFDNKMRAVRSAARTNQARLENIITKMQSDFQIGENRLIRENKEKLRKQEIEYKNIIRRKDEEIRKLKIDRMNKSNTINTVSKI